MIVYKITNKINGKCYVGQTVGPLEKRWKEHLSNKSHCTAVNWAIKKHHEDNFSREVLGLYENLDDLNAAEEYFIGFHNCLSPNGYNLKRGGDGGGSWSEEAKKRLSLSCMGRRVSEETKEKLRSINTGKKQSEETKRKTKVTKSSKVHPFLGKYHTEEAKKKMGDANRGKPSHNKGKPASKEARAKMSAAKIGTRGNNTGNIHSKETRQKMSAALKGRKGSRSTPIICLENGKMYTSQRQAAKDLNIHQTSIWAQLNGKRLHAKKYHFSYVNKQKGK